MMNAQFSIYNVQVGKTYRKIPSRAPLLVWWMVAERVH